MYVYPSACVHVHVHVCTCAPSVRSLSGDGSRWHALLSPSYNFARSQSSIYKYGSLKGFRHDNFAKFLLTWLKPSTFFSLKCKGIGFSVFGFLFKVSGPGAPAKPQSGEQTFMLRVQGTLRGDGKQDSPSCGLWGSRTGPAEGLQRC